MPGSKVGGKEKYIWKKKVFLLSLSLPWLTFTKRKRSSVRLFRGVFAPVCPFIYRLTFWNIQHRSPQPGALSFFHAFLLISFWSFCPSKFILSFQFQSVLPISFDSFNILLSPSWFDSVLWISFCHFNLILSFPFHVVLQTSFCPFNVTQ